MDNKTKLPGGPLATRPLHFVFIADCSGSMGGDKIQSLNHAIRESIPHMREVARGNPNAEVLVRSVKFSSGAHWHHSQATKVEQFEWTDLSVDGQTDMGRALTLVADALKTPPMPERALPPVLVLVSDGEPTDDFDSGLRKLMDEPWGKKAVRIAIAIGEDARKDVLQKFIGHAELQPLQANNAEQLVRYIRWASTAVLKAASAPARQTRISHPLSAPNPAQAL
jgi:uncharacterized protein YegL